MFRTVVLFLAPPHRLPATPSAATACPKPTALSLALRAVARWRRKATAGLVVFANALGLLLFLAGLGLVLRLAEVLLA